jgi:hypothetical protein
MAAHWVRSGQPSWAGIGPRWPMLASREAGLH